jgi:hypothetical protein
VLLLPKNKRSTREGKILIDIVDKKYGIGLGSPDYESLEFYGDVVLTMLIVDKIKYRYGLDVTPYILTELKKRMVENSALTQFAKELDVCYSVFNIPINKDLPKHNICSDTFESIIGILYIQYGMTNLNSIKKWLFSLAPIERYFDEELMILFHERQSELIEMGYIPYLIWDKQDDLDSFVQTYLSGNNVKWSRHKKGGKIDLVEEHSYDNMYDYYIVNFTYQRRLYLNTLEQGDKSGLKAALIDKGIWK